MVAFFYKFWSSLSFSRLFPAIGSYLVKPYHPIDELAVARNVGICIGNCQEWYAKYGQGVTTKQSLPFGAAHDVYIIAFFFFIIEVYFLSSIFD